MKVLYKFIKVLVVLSSPFWFLGAFVQPLFPAVKLPVSALVFCCPLFSVIVLMPKSSRWIRLRCLLRWCFDSKRATNTLSLLPIILLPIAIEVASYAFNFQHLPRIGEDNAMLFLPFLFFISALVEEVGWTAYLTNELQKELSPLTTSVIIGSLWALWHVIPYYQIGHSVNWIFWQCICTIISRVFMISIYNNSRGYFMWTVWYHMMINLSVFSLPGYVFHYNPTVTAILECAVLFLLFVSKKISLKSKYVFNLEVDEE
jgi:uncharacterized protein